MAAILAKHGWFIFGTFTMCLAFLLLYKTFIIDGGQDDD